MKICIYCNQEKHLDQFSGKRNGCIACVKQKYREKYLASKASGKVAQYKEANKEKISEYNKNYQKNLKKGFQSKKNKYILCQYKGGKCTSCSLEVTELNTCVFDFHHRDPKEKEYEPSDLLMMNKFKAKTELDKCDLLCSNCHRFYHNGVQIEDIIPGWDAL